MDLASYLFIAVDIRRCPLQPMTVRRFLLPINALWAGTSCILGLLGYRLHRPTHRRAVRLWADGSGEREQQEKLTSLLEHIIFRNPSLWRRPLPCYLTALVLFRLAPLGFSTTSLPCRSVPLSSAQPSLRCCSRLVCACGGASLRST